LGPYSALRWPNSDLRASRVHSPVSGEVRGWQTFRLAAGRFQGAPDDRLELSSGFHHN